MDLGERDRHLLGGTSQLVGAEIDGCGEQLLHGEPHPDNVLSTARGPLVRSGPSAHTFSIESDD